MIPLCTPKIPSACLGRASASEDSSHLDPHRQSRLMSAVTRETPHRVRTPPSTSPDGSNKRQSHGHRPRVRVPPRPEGPRGRISSREGHKASREPRLESFPCLRLRPTRHQVLCAVAKIIQIQHRRTAEMKFFVRFDLRLGPLDLRHQNGSRIAGISAYLLYHHNKAPSSGTPRPRLISRLSRQAMQAWENIRLSWELQIPQQHRKRARTRGH